MSDTLVVLPGEYLLRPKPFFYYIGASRFASEDPQGFFAVSDPGEVTRSHFHHVDQFQVYFGLTGSTFQRRPIGKAMVHYADSDTVYGPFTAGDEGLRWLTLRRSGADFTGFMPEFRAELREKLNRRHYEADLDEWMNEPLPVAGEVVTDEIFAKQPDGLFACKIAAAPGTTLPAIDPQGSGGQYYVVADGSIVFEDEEFPLYSAGWIGPTDEPLQLVAGENGARVFVLQFGSEPS